MFKAKWKIEYAPEMRQLKYTVYKRSWWGEWEYVTAFPEANLAESFIVAHATEGLSYPKHFSVTGYRVR